MGIILAHRDLFLDCEPIAHTPATPDISVTDCLKITNTAIVILLDWGISFRIDRRGLSNRIPGRNKKRGGENRNRKPETHYPTIQWPCTIIVTFGLRAKLSLRWLRVGGLRLLFRQTSDRVRSGFNLHGASLTTKQIESAGRLNVRPALVPVYLPYSKSVGSLNRPESLMLPWPY